MTNRITAEIDEVEPEAIIEAIGRIQHALPAAGFPLLDVRVPQKGYDALMESVPDHQGPAEPPGPLGDVPKWVTCLKGVPVSPIDDNAAL